MKIDCVGCLHGHYPQLQGGDLLIVTGDLTKSDNIQQNLEFFRWFNDQKYLKKILIAGNHDNHLVGPWLGGTKGPFREDKTFYDFDYLLDSGTEFEGLKIWGSPWTKTFPGMNPKCKAFTMDTEEELLDKWDLIPDDIDILITHGPPFEVLDKLVEEGKHAGSIGLHNAVMKRIKLKLHVFSHIHEGYGKYYIERFEKLWPKHPVKHERVDFINCSIMDENYKPVNKPVRIEL